MNAASDNHRPTPQANFEGKVLVVENLPELREILALNLHNAGEVVLEAACAESASQLWQQHGAEIGFLISDVNLQGRSGIELAHQLCAASAHLKCLLISGNPLEFSGLSGKAESRMRFLAKPFTGRDLIQALSALKSDAQ